MSKLEAGQTVRLNHDVEIWNEDDSLAARIEAGTPLRIIDTYGDTNYDVKVISPIYNGYTTNLDIEPEDIED